MLTNAVRLNVKVPTQMVKETEPMVHDFRYNILLWRRWTLVSARLAFVQMKLNTDMTN